MIRDGKMPQMNMESGCYYVYPEFQDYIRKADVISIQIGSNDAFVPCVAGLWNATNHKSDALASIILSGTCAPPALPFPPSSRASRTWS